MNDLPSEHAGREDYEKLLTRLREARAEFAGNEVKLVGCLLATLAAYDYLRTDPVIYEQGLAEPLSALARASQTT